MANKSEKDAREMWYNIAVNRKMTRYNLDEKVVEADGEKPQVWKIRRASYDIGRDSYSEIIVFCKRSELGLFMCREDDTAFFVSPVSVGFCNDGKIETLSDLDAVKKRIVALK